MLKTESRTFVFSCAYAAMTSLVTPRLFSTFLSESTPFSCLTSIFKFRSQTAFQINLLLSIAIKRWYAKMDFRFFIQYGRYNKPERKRLIAHFMTPF